MADAAQKDRAQIKFDIRPHLPKEGGSEILKLFKEQSFEKQALIAKRYVVKGFGSTAVNNLKSFADRGGAPLALRLKNAAADRSPEEIKESLEKWMSNIREEGQTPGSVRIEDDEIFYVPPSDPEDIEDGLVRPILYDPGIKEGFSKRLAKRAGERFKERGGEAEGFLENVGEAGARVKDLFAEGFSSLGPPEETATDIAEGVGAQGLKMAGGTLGAIGGAGAVAPLASAASAVPVVGPALAAVTTLAGTGAGTGLGVMAAGAAQEAFDVLVGDKGWENFDLAKVGTEGALSALMAVPVTAIAGVGARAWFNVKNGRELYRALAKSKLGPEAFEELSTKQAERTGVKLYKEILDDWKDKGATPNVGQVLESPHLIRREATSNAALARGSDAIDDLRSFLFKRTGVPETAKTAAIPAKEVAKGNVGSVAPKRPGFRERLSRKSDLREANKLDAEGRKDLAEFINRHNAATRSGNSALAKEINREANNEFPWLRLNIPDEDAVRIGTQNARPRNKTRVLSEQAKKSGRAEGDFQRQIQQGKKKINTADSTDSFVAGHEARDAGIEGAQLARGEPRKLIEGPLRKAKLERRRIDVRLRRAKKKNDAPLVEKLERQRTEVESQIRTIRDQGFKRGQKPKSEEFAMPGREQPAAAGSEALKRSKAVIQEEFRSPAQRAAKSVEDTLGDVGRTAPTLQKAPALELQRTKIKELSQKLTSKRTKNKGASTLDKLTQAHQEAIAAGLGDDAAQLIVQKGLVKARRSVLERIIGPQKQRLVPGSRLKGRNANFKKFLDLYPEEQQPALRKALRTVVKQQNLTAPKQKRMLLNKLIKHVTDSLGRTSTNTLADKLVPGKSNFAPASLNAFVGRTVRTAGFNIVRDIIRGLNMARFERSLIKDPNKMIALGALITGDKALLGHFARGAVGASSAASTGALIELFPELEEKLKKAETEVVRKAQRKRRSQDE